jgi:hypothetical protein
MAGTALGAACLAAVLHYKKAEPVKAAPPADDSTATEVAALREETARLSQQLEQQRALSGTRVEAAHPEAAPARASAPAAARPRAPEVSDAEIRDRTRVKFESETPDPQWAAGASKRSYGEMAKALPSGSRILSNECRRSMCRAEIAHPDLRSFQQHMQSMISDSETQWPGPFMGAVTSTGDDGAVTAEAYFVRDGEDPVGQAFAEAREEKLALRGADTTAGTAEGTATAR